MNPVICKTIKQFKICFMGYTTGRENNGNVSMLYILMFNFIKTNHCFVWYFTCDKTKRFIHLDLTNINFGVNNNVTQCGTE